MGNNRKEARMEKKNEIARESNRRVRNNFPDYLTPLANNASE